jgi:hypothetical protein
MSDNSSNGSRAFGAKRSAPAALAAAPTSGTAGPPSTGRWYRTIECHLDAGGAFRIQLREYLSRAVYDRSTTFRFLSAEAKKLLDSQAVGVIDEEGKLVYLLAGKTGRFASADLKKLVIAKLAADGGREAEEQAAEASPKRTSRKPKAPGPKRTSRKKRGPAAAVEPGKPAKRTSKRGSRRKKPKPASAPAVSSGIWNP